MCWRMVRRSACVGLVLFSAAIPAGASTAWDTYDQLEAMISAPDVVEPDTDFSVYVKGNIINGGSFDIYAYSLYEDADWHYDQNHMVVVDSGTLIDASGFNFGKSYVNTYTLNKPAGTHKYTFIFGYRTSAHNIYDLAVEVSVTMTSGGSVLVADTYFLTGDGGKVHFTLTAGANHADRSYLILGSVTGTYPGFPLPGGLATLPLNWDVFTGIVYRLANTPALADFQGKLDAFGNAGAQLDTFGPLPPTAVGLTMYYAYLLHWPFDFVSNSVSIAVVP